jgi:Domain of unknown function (DUF4159)
MFRIRIGLAAILVVLLSTLAFAQFFGGGRRGGGERMRQNLDISKTDFVFARWQIAQSNGWWHDYPDAEEHITQIMSEATGVNVDKNSYLIVPLESKDIFKYPFGYISEPGMMTLSDEEVKNFREFVDRGGFVMLDDFDNARQFEVMKENMSRVFPDRPLIHLKGDHNILRTYYTIDSLYVESPYDVGAPAEFWGINGEDGNLQVIICFNNDVGDFWEYIDRPEYALKPSAEALRLGINFVLYAMTH